MIYIASRRDPMGADGRAQPRRGRRRLHRGPDRDAEDRARRPRLDTVLLTLFIFVYLCNLPGSSRSCRSRPPPVWRSRPSWRSWCGLVYNVVGFKHNGLSYLTGMLSRQRAQADLRPLVGLIEFLSNIILRPFSLAVRLFANMLAGHMLLVTFALLSNALLFAETKQLLPRPLTILPLFMLLFLTAFEVLVGLLQAYIFTILTGVYIGLAAPRALIAARSPPPQSTGEPQHGSARRTHRPGSRRTRRPSTPPSAPASPTASPRSARASASVTSSARRSRRWPASPRRPAWSARRCSSASPSPRRSP